MFERSLKEEYEITEGAISSKHTEKGKKFRSYIHINGLAYREHKMTVDILLELNIINSFEETMTFVFSIGISSI